MILVFSLVILRVSWISDDAFITFRSIENFVHGYGPVYNVGERVQTFTHPLWMLLLGQLLPAQPSRRPRCSRLTRFHHPGMVVGFHGYFSFNPIQDDTGANLSIHPCGACFDKLKGLYGFRCIRAGEPSHLCAYHQLRLPAAKASRGRRCPAIPYGTGIQLHRGACRFEPYGHLTHHTARADLWVVCCEPEEGILVFGAARFPAFHRLGSLQPRVLRFSISEHSLCKIKQRNCGWCVYAARPPLSGELDFTGPTNVKCCLRGTGAGLDSLEEGSMARNQPGDGLVPGLHYPDRRGLHERPVY